MRRRDFREKRQPLVMIIPMIDIMLFLLVFFMMSTIYMQTNTIAVSLPKTSSAAQETRPKVLAITVTAHGEIFFDKESITNEQLIEKVRAAIQSDNDTVFVLRGDKDARYESVAAVLDTLKQSGARRVSIATEIK